MEEEEEEDLPDIIPPSPIASSSQVSELASDPRLPSPVATSTQISHLASEPRLPSPVATSTQISQPASGPRLPSPVATSTQISQLASEPRLPSPVATSTQISQLASGPRLPRLPQLPDIGTAGEGSSRNEEPSAPQLSPIATAGPSSRSDESGNGSQSGTSGASALAGPSGSRIMTTQGHARIMTTQGHARIMTTQGHGSRAPLSTSLQGWVVRLPDIDAVLYQQQSQIQRHRLMTAPDNDTGSSSSDVEIISGTESSVDDTEDSNNVSEVDSDEDTVVDEEEIVPLANSPPGGGEAHGGRQGPLLQTAHDVASVPAHGEQSQPVRGGQDTQQTQPEQGRESLSDQGAELLTRGQGRQAVSSEGVQPTPGTPVVVIQRLNPDFSSPADFRSPKRRRIVSPAKCSVAETKKVAADDEDDNECCPICFEAWTTSGAHRLSALKCGHLFGQSCIEKWLRGQGGKCPQCNAKAKRQDVRVLFAKSVKALDTTERDRAFKDLESERECRRKAEMEAAQLRLQFQMAIEETNKTRLELEKLKSQIRRQGVSNVASSSSSSTAEVKVKLPGEQAGQFVLDRTIKICDAGNCRVMAYSPSLATLVVSQPSSSPLFPGFGIKKISTLDFKTSQYLTIHSKAIRDVCFHPFTQDGMLLSCGLDKKVKMTNLLSNSIVQSYDTPMPAWSCVWNADDSNYFYAGLQNGLVLEFDIRNTGEAVQEFNKEGSRSPVAALSYLPSNNRAEFRPGGLLIGQLDKVTFYESLPEHEHRLHILPLEGSLTSLRAEPSTRHVVASYRPAARHPTIRHELCEMVRRDISTNPTVIDNVCSCNVVHSFHGGRTQTVLSRTAVLPHPRDGNRLLICAGDETSSSVHVWDSGTGELTQKLATGGVTADLCSFSINRTVYLSALTDKQCKVFKWT